MKRFNIRVYGICLNSQQDILLSHERYSSMEITKFPGGGLEFGEGMKDCLKREFMEEFNLVVEVGELFFLTDFFQLSAFSDDDQVVSVYYQVHINPEELDRVLGLDNGREKLFWCKKRDFSSKQLTFPIDKLVASKLVEGNCQ